MGTLLLDVRRGHNLSGQVQPFAQVLEALGGQGVVVVLPREAGLEVAARGQGLASLDDLGAMLVWVSVRGFVTSYVEVLDVDVAMLLFLSEICCFAGDENQL